MYEKMKIAILSVKTAVEHFEKFVQLLKMAALEFSDLFRYTKTQTV